MANTFEEVTLIDTESNIEYKITITSVDANKARNDREFTCRLLQNVKGFTTNADEGVLLQSEDIDNMDSTTSSSNENESLLEIKDQHIWTSSETLLLLNLYKEHVINSDNKRKTSKQYWTIISKLMKDTGYEIHAIKCATKFQCLKRTYKSIIDHNKKSGNSRKYWEYYEIMHKIFSEKPWIKPETIAGSNVSANNETENIDSKVPKKRKLKHMLENYLDKSIQLKEKKEQSAQKRHEEKMAYLQRLENLIANMQ